MAPAGTVIERHKDAVLSSSLSRDQVQKASKALLKRIRSPPEEKNETSKAKNLLDSDESSEESLWLILTTKTHVTPQKRLKPCKIPLPHTLNESPAVTICLITPEPQRSYKDALSSADFPKPLTDRIKRVIDVKKLSAKYHSFESKRQLMDSYDIFLADDRIITYLPKALGKTFYSSSTKRPIPIRLQASKSKDEKQKKSLALPSTKKSKSATESKSLVTPAQMAHEIERTLSMTTANISATHTTAVRIGRSSFTAEQLSENVDAVVNYMVENIIPKKWMGVKSIHVKGPSTMALPIWLAEELWEQDTQVLEEAEVETAKLNALSKRKQKRLLEGNASSEDSRKRLADESAENDTERKKRRKGPDDGMSTEMKERREKLRKQKREIGSQIESRV